LGHKEKKKGRGTFTLKNCGREGFQGEKTRTRKAGRSNEYSEKKTSAGRSGIEGRGVRTKAGKRDQ